MEPFEARWMFLDMDSFFASAEQHLRPQLRQTPVGVIPLESGTTCVIAASFDAKRCGIRVGTPVAEARERCPGIVLLKARPDQYVRLHNRLKTVIDGLIPITKTYSIDEWGFRLAPVERREDRAFELARAVRASIAREFSPTLGCSIGIAATRLLAKTACDLDKPGGLRVLRTGDVPTALAHLAPADLPGVSKAMARRLADEGFDTVGALWSMTRREARAVWGSVVGERWWNGFHGIDEAEIETRRGAFGHANVLEPRFRNGPGARRMAARLVCRLGVRLRREGYAAGRLSLAVATSTYGRPGRAFQAETTLPHVQETPALLGAFAALWGGYDPSRRGRPVRVGVTVSSLVRASQVSGSLFGRLDRDRALSETLDSVNGKFGRNTLYFGAVHGCTHRMDDKIAFGRIPPEDEDGATPLRHG
ncbi:MAG: type VI secretion protein ImpB [Planctomycetota bacterium]